MKKLLALTLGFVTLAFTGTNVMNQTQTIILNRGYNQWGQLAVLTNFANRQPTTAPSGLALLDFDYNFNALTIDQTIYGQDNWVKSESGNVVIRKGPPGINPSQTAKGEGIHIATGAIRPLDDAFYYTSKDTKVVWGSWGYVHSSGINISALGGIGTCLFGPSQLGGQTELTTFLQRQPPLKYLTGDVVQSDHWYDYRVTVDFSKNGGEATLSYRDVTKGSGFKTDNVIKNVPLGLVPDGSGRYGFFQVYVRNDGGGYVDNLHFDAPAPSNPQKKGMTWFHSTSNATYGTITVGCGPAGPDRCDPAHGDTLCTQQLPVLCIYKPKPAFPLPVGLMVPNDYNRWSGGVVATTQPVAGNTFANSAAVTAYCKATFGDGWRVAEFHDGLYWNFQAYGGSVSAPTVPSTRFWVHINDQKDGNCWQP